MLNLFNLLDARGAISVTERVGVIGRIRESGRGRGQGVRAAAGSIEAAIQLFSSSCASSNELRFEPTKLELMLS